MIGNKEDLGASAPAVGDTSDCDFARSANCNACNNIEGRAYLADGRSCGGSQFVERLFRPWTVFKGEIQVSP